MLSTAVRAIRERPLFLQARLRFPSHFCIFEKENVLQAANKNPLLKTPLTSAENQLLILPLSGQVSYGFPILAVFPQFAYENMTQEQSRRH